MARFLILALCLLPAILAEKENQVPGGVGGQYQGGMYQGGQYQGGMMGGQYQGGMMGGQFQGGMPGGNMLQLQQCRALLLSNGFQVLGRPFGQNGQYGQYGTQYGGQYGTQYGPMGDEPEATQAP